MSYLLNDWNLLDKEHKEFVLRVMDSKGSKHGAEPEIAISDANKHFGLWVKAQESGFIECVGSYKWLVTDKFIKLHRELFEI